ncbi:MAG: hypothetical protein F9K40_08370 [Kofleriaceae bacterium]|nr:MAG: hypothetical protein F9K40_08370 [Kofleriaceae bacterium]MBZ0116188.1 hypothetical protein [Sandaracinaceae bacterium]
MSRTFLWGGALTALLSAACDRTPTTSITSQAMGSFDYECGAGPVQLSGDPADPRSIVIENGIVRVSYPQLASGNDQLGAHMLELMIDGQWQRVLGNWYGDWTFFVAPLYESAHTAHVITETPDVVEVAFEFDHWLDYPGSYSTRGHVPRWWDESTQGPCEESTECRCYLGGCGVPAIDWEGSAIFPHNYLDTPKYIRHVTFTKVIRVERCGPGYFVGYHSTPTLTWGSWIDSDPYQSAAGEREHGLGWVSSVTFASSGVVVRNPEAGAHTSLGIVEQPVGPWWFSSLPDAADYGLFIAEEHPMPSFVWQFAPTHAGTPLVHKMNPRIGVDGRPMRYQSFLGAYPYVMADRNAEPTPEAQAAVVSRLPLQWP